MKKNYFLLMAMLLFAVVGFTSCSDDDEGGISGNASAQLVGEWMGVYYESYEIYEGEKEEWNESLVGEGLYVTFHSDGTAESDGVYADWEVSGNTLIMDGVRFTILTLNATTLILEYKESYGGGDGLYEKYTFERVD